mmetsp:Transcript_2684/g.5510  ORF Transcript_2684/g.5510 Transcript_2684/m.5510 type:complete len:202 (-) Transcript_2684:1390-1995(-)
MPLYRPIEMLSGIFIPITVIRKNIERKVSRFITSPFSTTLLKEFGHFFCIYHLSDVTRMPDGHHFALTMASMTTVACLAPFTLCTRRTLHPNVLSFLSFPRQSAATQDPAVPKSRSSAMASPLNSPINLFLLVPNNNGKSPSFDLKCEYFLRRLRLPSISFAKPIPGSSICIHRGIPASSAALDRSNRASTTPSTTPPWSS